jgi:hypothetical protein
MKNSFGFPLSALHFDGWKNSLNSAITKAALSDEKMVPEKILKLKKYFQQNVANH